MQGQDVAATQKGGKTNLMLHESSYRPMKTINPWNRCNSKGFR
ncbi:hypothetical protein G1C97_1825 [Bifidobacterium sp. DSM 109959]|uniref:Uncharacterized protein n=1 Tax=Bifidobacterium olomucense TaxID=2675324 RepID=A0A7Y0HY16_9BIFI|nr:hypothetical protein [Bifidobacterium sp. DSM 109959]